MKTNTLFRIVLMIFAIKILTLPVIAEPGNTKAPVAQTEIKAKSDTAKYPGYSVDGRTSASVLAAQRSHTIEGKDERNFAVFTGIAAILILYIFLQIFVKNR